MSEENKQIEVSVGFVGAEGQIQIEFADGARLVPDYIVAELGAEALSEIAPKLKEISFAEFLDGFHQLVQKRRLNNYQQEFIGKHFANFR